MECSRCNQPIPEGEKCNYHVKLMCEDCYIQALHRLEPVMWQPCIRLKSIGLYDKNVAIAMD